MQVDIIVSDNPSQEDRGAILAPLVAYNASKVGTFAARPVAILLRDKDGGSVVGGLWARTTYEWLFIELVAIPESLRGTGIGTEIMRRAEALAREQGCVGVRLDTYSFQAPAFYQKLGYEIFGVIEDHPRGAQRFFLRKYLAPATP